MTDVGHNHERDGKLRVDCEGCIEERWYMLILKGKTKAEADEQIRNELNLYNSLNAYPPARQIER